jgi:hypothetical protein
MGNRRLQYACCFVVLLIGSSWSLARGFAPSDAVETVGAGEVNWTSGEMLATGIGAPPANAVNPAQARAMALRAATVVAYRNLLEVAKGVQIDSETVVENFMTKSDVIRTRVKGIVKGARFVKTQYMSDGAVEVTVALPMKGAFLDVIVPESFGGKPVPLPPAKPSPAPQEPSPTRQTPPLPAPSQQPLKLAPGKKAEPVRPEPPRQEPERPAPIPVQPQPEKRKEPMRAEPVPPVAAQEQSTTQFKGGKATGLVIDGRGLGLKPALLPKIVDPEGREIYVGQVVTRTNAVEQGVAGYAKDVNAAASNFRVTDNPAVIKGVRASGAARTDVMLGRADADALRELSKRGDFLQYCRVIIVY